MRAMVIALAVAAALSATAARAHGPQIQITRDHDTITTRRILREEPYYTRLTRPTSVYVIPLTETGGVWYARPNDTPSPTIPGVPLYISGPGIAYGYDRVDSDFEAFAGGFRFELKLIAGLQLWDGTTWGDPGLEEIEAFRTTGTPARTSDSLTPSTPATLAYGNVAANYNETVHSGASFRMLGNGTSSLVEGGDGVYKLTMSYASMEPGLRASEPFFFLLHKNASADDVQAAVGSLGIAQGAVQFVPEPGTGVLVVAVAAWLGLLRPRRNVLRESLP